MNELTSEVIMERGVLASILCNYNPEESDALFMELTAEDFSTYPTRTIFQTMKEMFYGNTEINSVSLLGKLEIKRVEGISQEYLERLIEDVTTPGLTRTYKIMIKRNIYMRKIRAALMGLHPEVDPAAVEHILELINQRDSAEKKILVTPSDFIDKYLENLKKGKHGGIPTGFPTLDRNVYAQAGDLIVVGARTNVGKTTYLTNILMYMLENKVSCLYCPTEMKPDGFMNRILPLVINVTASKFRSLDFKFEDLAELEGIGAMSRTWPVHFLDRASPDISDIAQSVRKSGCKVLFVDYLGRCAMPHENTRMREVERFMVDLKNLCVDKKILCFLAVQLSRATDFLKDTEPRLADLSDSSAIEKEADAVVFLWRDSADKQVYNVPISAVLAKNRHGMLMRWKMDFDKYQMRMTEQGNFPKAAQHDHNESGEQDMLPVC